MPEAVGICWGFSVVVVVVVQLQQQNVLYMAQVWCPGPTFLVVSCGSSRVARACFVPRLYDRPTGEDGSYQFRRGRRGISMVAVVTQIYPGRERHPLSIFSGGYDLESYDQAVCETRKSVIPFHFVHRCQLCTTISIFTAVYGNIFAVFFPR